MRRTLNKSAAAPTPHSAAEPAEFNAVCRSKSNLPNRTDSNNALLPYLTRQLNTGRFANESVRQRVSLPTTSSPTYEVDSPTSNVSSPTYVWRVNERTRNKLYGVQVLGSLANWHSTLANRLHTLANWSLVNWLVGETTGYPPVRFGTWMERRLEWA